MKGTKPLEVTSCWTQFCELSGNYLNGYFSLEFFKRNSPIFLTRSPPSPLSWFRWLGHCNKFRGNWPRKLTPIYAKFDSSRSLPSQLQHSEVESGLSVGAEVTAIVTHPFPRFNTFTGIFIRETPANAFAKVTLSWPGPLLLKEQTYHGISSTSSSSGSVSGNSSIASPSIGALMFSMICSNL